MSTEQQSRDALNEPCSCGVTSKLECLANSCHKLQARAALAAQPQAAQAVPPGWKLAHHHDDSITLESPDGSRWRYDSFQHIGTRDAFIYRFLSEILTAAQVRHRKPLTDAQIFKACESTGWIVSQGFVLELARAIEAAHGIKEQ